MARYRLLNGTHFESDAQLRLHRYVPGDIVESERDLVAAFNRENHPSGNGPCLQRFELVEDEQH